MRHRVNGREFDAIFSITHEAAQVLGLDDSARYADIYRSDDGRFVLCCGTVEGLSDLVTEMEDRATEGVDGYGENARNKAIMRRNVARVIRWTHGAIVPRK